MGNKPDFSEGITKALLAAISPEDLISGFRSKAGFKQTLQISGFSWKVNKLKSLMNSRGTYVEKQSKKS